MIGTIAMRELRSMFLSPLAWIVLAVIQVILSWSFFTQIDFFFSIQSELATTPNAPGVTDLVIMPVFELASVVFLFATPLLTMRLLSEERSNGTLALLMSSPISMTQIVFGKFFGIFMFMMIFVFMFTLMPLSLSMGTELDLGKISAGLLALALLLAAFSAAGLYISSLTDNILISAFSTFGFLLLLWIVSSGATTDNNAFSLLSISAHFSPMLRGLVNTADITYFIIFIATFLVLTIKQLDSKRLQG